MVRIVASPRMASLTSLHLGGRALALATFESAADLETLPEAADRMGGAWPCLAAGRISSPPMASCPLCSSAAAWTKRPP
ncbi:MAG: hypothetical protein V8Q91_11175 [Bilophila wadsworthia]|uniref:hypothetical protein n=1 Tax=Bilophila wadsworthia TaxID=35833 RepID=UPI00300F0F97